MGSNEPCNGDPLRPRPTHVRYLVLACAASLALVALGTALVLMRGDQPFTTWILLIATWGLFGSALTLAVLTSVFGVHYPTDYLIGRNYFITFGELVVCVPLLRLESQRRRRERWAMEEVAVVTPTRRERSE